MAAWWCGKPNVRGAQVGWSMIAYSASMLHSALPQCGTSSTPAFMQQLSSHTGQGRGQCALYVISLTTLQMYVPCKFCSHNRKQQQHSSSPQLNPSRPTLARPWHHRAAGMHARRHWRGFASPGIRAGAHSHPAASGTSVPHARPVRTGQKNASKHQLTHSTKRPPPQRQAARGPTNRHRVLVRALQAGAALASVVTDSAVV